MNSNGLSDYMHRVTEEWIPAVARHRNADRARARAAVQRAHEAIERHNSMRPQPGDVATAAIPLPAKVPSR